MPHMDESAPRIPNKQYFRIGEVSRIIGVPAYVLRFWETEFRRIKPRRTATGQRIYHRDDLTTIMLIKNLLYDQQYTIKGARRHLNRMALGQSQPNPPISERSQQTQLAFEESQPNPMTLEQSQPSPMTQQQSRRALPPDRMPAAVDHDLLRLLRRELKTIRDLLE